MATTTVHPDFPHLDWIYQLPEDFYRQPQNLAGLGFARPSTVLTDLVIRTGLASWMAGISLPAGYLDHKLGKTMRYERTSHFGDDQAIFHQPRHLPVFAITQAPRPKKVKGGIFERIQWHSIYEEEDHVSHFNNDQVVAWRWRHGDKPRPTIIMVHGFLASWWEVNEYYLGARYLYDLGCDLVLKTLPHHGPRSKNAKNVSGMDFVSNGIDAINHSVVQSTYDIRSLLDILQHQGVESIGITGVSLGGYTTALMAGLDDRLAFAMPVMPLVSFPDAMMEWKPLDIVIKMAMGFFDANMQELRASMGFHSPLARPSQLASERLMIIAGLGDRFASPRHAQLLQQHWGQCRLQWHNGAHAKIKQQGKINQAKKEFLQNIGFIGSKAEIPLATDSKMAALGFR